MKVVGPWVLTKPVESPEKIGSIIVPKKAEPDPTKELVVVQISKDLHAFEEEDGYKIRYKVGDIVICNRQAGIEMDVNGEKLEIIKYDSPFAVKDA